MSQKSTSDRAMQEYLSALLEEEQPSALDRIARAPVEQLLASVETTPPEPIEVRQEQPLMTEKAKAQMETTPVAAEPEVVEPEAEPEVEQTSVPETEEKLPPIPPEQPDYMEEYRDEPFQVLFFKVAGLNLAVPLKSLGGIHKWEKPKPLFGKPKWYLGIMPHREEQLNVVDSARWVMPEKYTEELAKSLNYQYLVMLSESHWGLACESLVNTETLTPDEIQWRGTGSAHGGKRPWLAGIVKEKMCALVNVEAMIEMLNQGIDNGENKSSVRQSETNGGEADHE